MIPRPASLFGNLLAVAGAVTLATYQVIGRGLRATLPLNAYMLAVWGTATLTLAGLMAAFGTRFAPFPPRTWLAFAALAVVPTLGGHGLTNRALRSLPAPTVGLFLLGEPVIASLLAMASVPRDALAGHSRRRCHRPRSTGAGPDAAGMRRSGQLSR